MPSTSPSPPSMLALLDLPRELRVKILSLAVAAPSLAPPDPFVAGNRTELHDVYYRSWGKGSNVMYLQGWNRTDSFPTLLVNRQLHSETLAALDHLPTRHSYTLDVVVANEKALYPTWLCVPTLTNRVDKVFAAFRIVGAGTSGGVFPGWDEDGDGLPRIQWCVYSLLERFLLVGPVGHQEKEVDRGVTVKILELDVRTPNVPEDMLAPKDMEVYNHLLRLRRKTGIDYIMRPETLLDFIAHEIGFLLGNPEDVSEIFYERLGRVRLMLDGELHKEWDVARILANFQFSGPLSGAMARWKARTYKVRVQLDLPVIPVEGGEIEV